MTEASSNVRRPTSPEPGPIGRWVGHWSFWPVYVGLVLLFLAWLRPWHKWSETGRATAGAEWDHYGVRLHERDSSAALFRDDWPIGSVVMIRGTAESAPEGWLLCDGRTALQSEFAELLAIAGPRFEQVGDRFRLPDFRGLSCEPANAATFKLIESLSIRELDSATSARPPVQVWLKAR